MKAQPLAGERRSNIAPIRASGGLFAAIPLVERFWPKVAKGGADECWEWQASRTLQGYGHTTVRGACLLTHRISWEFANGPIPAGLLVCHKCDNPPCCNPAHLFLGTHGDNMRDRFLKNRDTPRKTHCLRGHALAGENLLVGKGRNNTATHKCRTCIKIWRREGQDRVAAQRGARP